MVTWSEYRMKQTTIGKALPLKQKFGPDCKKTSKRIELGWFEVNGGQ